MVSPVLEKELHRHLDDLLPDQQRQVLDFARALATTQIRGVAGEKLLPFAGAIEPDELKTMSQAIEQDCGQIDSHGW